MTDVACLAAMNQCSSKRDKNIHLEPDELPLRSRRRTRYRLSGQRPRLGLGRIQIRAGRRASGRW
jgi:hypothetical protein